MKKLFFFALLLTSISSFAQTNVYFAIGTSNNYVTINEQDYKRGYITYRWYLSGSDTLIELAREYNTSQPFRSGRLCTYYKDANNGDAAFTSFAAWREWWRSYGAPTYDTIVGGGGITSLTAGTGLSGGTITTSGTISLLQQGTSGAMSGGTVTVTCASCTTSSIILVQEVQDAGTPTGIAQIVVTRNNGSFDITNVRATSDGNKFMYQVVKY